MAEIIYTEQANDNQWDSFVFQHPNGWLTNTSDWQNVIEKTFKHIKGYRLILVDHDTADIYAGISVYTVSSYLTGKRLVSIPFGTICDPLVDKKEHFDKLLEGIIAFKEKKGCDYFELRSSFKNDLLNHGELAEKAFYVQHYLNVQSPDELFKKFHRTCTRQRINRALKSNFVVLRAKTEEQLKIFYSIYTNARKRLSLPPMPYKLIVNLWQTFYPKNQIDLLIAEKDGLPVAGVILLKYKSRLSIEFAASDDKYWKLSPNHLLFWEAIKIAFSEGFKVVDFGRTSPLNTSLMDFKKRWGTKEIIMPHYYYPTDQAPDLAKAEKSFKYRIAQRICRIAPIPLLPLIGRFCYKHLG